MSRDQKTKLKFLLEILVALVAIAGFVISLINRGDTLKLSKDLRLLENSPKYQESLRASVVNEMLLVENISKVSLHNLGDEYQELLNPNTIHLGNGQKLDLLPGDKFFFVIPEQFLKNLKADEILVARITYSYNNDPFDKIDTRLTIEGLQDPLYELRKRFTLLEESGSSQFILKFDGKTFNLVQ